jgi:trehalose 6-phosphate synthase
MTEDLNVVLVSNRGPVSFVDTGDGFETKRGAGGLAGALDPVARQLGDHATWIAAATSPADRKALAAGAADGLEAQLGYRVYLLDFDERTYADYYDVVSNRMLWFANHCLWDELDVHDFGQSELDAWTSAYEPVNAHFARVTAEVADPDALVLFQDYHLATAPGHLRKLRPKQTIFHFTHSSFCGPDGLDPLPDTVAHSVVEGMLGADLVGFHVPEWAAGFLSACEQTGARVDRRTGRVEHAGRTSWVRTYPIPIDAGELRARVTSPAVRAWVDRLRPRDEDRLLVRADRLEPSKNIVRGFEAFGLFRDEHPDASDVRFVACLYPSRQSMPEYRDYAERVEEAARRVNERHPGAVDLYTEDDFDRTLAALSLYDVLIVNPLMDGMNLVAKEGPALNQRAGVLVLSRGAGSFDELGDASITLHDPTDVRATADALHAAFSMDPERRQTLARRLKKKATDHEPEAWINSQLEDLAAIRGGGEPSSAFRQPRG